MERIVSPAARAGAEAPYSSEVYVYMLTISHPRLSRKIRIACDLVDYIYGGERFYGFPSDITMLTDADAKPTAQITIQNVDREIGEEIQALEDSPRLTLELLLASGFSVTVDPVLKARTEIGTAVPEYKAAGLRLEKASGDALAISGNVVSYDYSDEPWPFFRATKNRAPGLWRS